MALIKSYKGLKPKWGKDCYFSENATIVGDVKMGDNCSIWFNAVVRGDVAPITIGNCSNVQDGSCVHVTHETGPTHIGSYVTIGHNVTVHACTIHDHALIGMGATLLDGCEIGEGAIVAAGALVETIFNADIVDERLTRILRIGACAHLTAYDDTYSVAPEALGETETVVGSGGARGAEALFHAQREVDALQGFAGDVRNLTL